MMLFKSLGAITKIFLPVCLCILVYDTWSNAFKVTEIYPDMTFGFCILSAVLASGNLLLPYYADGDRLVSFASVIVMLTTLCLSTGSGFVHIQQKKLNHSNGSINISEMKQELEKEYNDKAIFDCRREDGCYKDDMKKRKNYLVDTIRSNRQYESNKRFWWLDKMDWLIMFAMSVPCVIGFAGMRIIANAAKREGCILPSVNANTLNSGRNESVKETLERLQDLQMKQKNYGSDGSDGSKPKNQSIKKMYAL